LLGSVSGCLFRLLPGSAWARLMGAGCWPGGGSAESLAPGCRAAGSASFLFAVLTPGCCWVTGTSHGHQCNLHFPILVPAPLPLVPQGMEQYSRECDQPEFKAAIAEVERYRSGGECSTVLTAQCCGHGSAWGSSGSPAVHGWSLAGCFALGGQPVSVMPPVIGWL
jgi:hypothetical protein